MFNKIEKSCPICRRLVKYINQCENIDEDDYNQVFRLMSDMAGFSISN
jgi:hypothetical protein